ncbi:Ig-like domain-containing protein, partial [Pseudarcicella hirudinis]
NFTGSGSSYSVEVTPTADGTITVDVAAGVANDLSGNPNTAATQFSIVSDRTAPVATITSTSTSPTNASPIVVNINFSKNVTGFVIGDIIVAGGTKSNFTGSGSSYSVNITPSADGTITVDVGAGAANDAAGNGNPAATQFSIVSDRTIPTVTIASASASPTNASPVTVNFTFSKSVTGFAIGDITVAGGSKSNFTGSGTSYSVDITPSGDGTITVDVAAGVATDGTGNGNAAATQFSIVSDRTAPTVAISSTSTSPTNASPIVVNFTFSESVTGFTIGDITVAGGTKGNFTGSGSNYSVEITPGGDGTITVNVGAGVANDLAGNGNTAATQFSIVSDMTAPTVVISSTSTSPTNASPITVNFTFSENVTGFAVGDITVAGGTKSNFTGSGSSYSVDITPAADGTITVNVGGNAANDAAGNGNTEATQFSIVSERTNPSVSVSSTSTSPTNTSPITVNFTFSKNVTGFVIGDITVAGGSKSNFTGSGSGYSVDVTPTGDGTITVDVAANVANDGANNGNTAATQFSIVSDRTAPTVAISSTSTSPTNASPIVVNFTFSESVTGFAIGDITVAGGTKGNFTGSGSNYSVEITPGGDGTITVNVGAGVANDLAGNGNTAATQFSIVSDRTKPGVTIASTSSNPTSTSPIPLTFVFSKSVSDFTNGDVVVSGGSLSNFTGSGTNYSADLLPSINGTITVDVPANIAVDGSGNNNTAATQFSIQYVNNPPVLITSGGPTAFIQGTTPSVVIDPGVTVSDIDDLTLRSGTVSIAVNFQSGEDVLSFDYDAGTMGNITGSYSAGVMSLSSASPYATVAQWQAAFRAVKYSNTSATPNTGSRTTSFVVNDGQNNSTAYGKIITITPKPIITVAAILVVSGTKGTLEATGCTGGTVNWFGSSSTADLTVLGTGVTFQSPDPVTAAISFYAQCTIGLAVSDRTEGKITLRDCSGLIASAGPGGTFTGLETYKLTGVTTASGGTTPYTYEWTTSPVVSIDDATIANPEVGPFTQNTTVNIKVTDDFGCSSTSSVVVNYDECRLSATITGNGDLCSSSQVTLTVNVTGAKNPVSYLWCDNSTGSSLVVTTPNTYCLKVTDASGCTHFEQVVVTKTALSTPTIAVVGGTNPLIGPGSVILEADCDGNSVNWFDANNNLLPNVSLNSFRYETVILSSSTTFYAECNKSTCTSSRGSIYITVIPLPDAPTLDAPILCDWGKPTVNATGCAGTVNWYWWASGGNPIATGNAFMSPDVFKTSDYVYADCEVGGIHSLRVRTLVTISPLPEASIKVMSGKVAFCAGDATTLIGNNDREVKGYQWKKDGQILGGRTNRELGVSESGRYSVITFSDRCQRESESVMITAVPLPSAPVIVPKSSLSFCQGLSVQLVAQTQGDFSELRWYKEGTNVGYQKEYWAEISGRYSLRATNYLGCVSPESGSVFVNVLPNPAKPKIYADGKTTVCEDVKINLTISTDPAFRYSWSRQDGKTYATQFIAGITERGVYDLVVTDNNGCNSPKATLEVIVHKLPDAPIIKASGPTEFCEGSSVDLTANVIETPTSQIISYEWKTGEKGTGFKTIKALQGSSSTRKYAVRATDQVGCVSLYSEEILIKVNPNPAKPSISANAPLTYCDNNLTTLTATKATKYLWSSGETTQSIKPGISGNYGLTVENDFGCKSPQSDILTVKVNLSPNIPAIKADGLLEFCDGNKVELTASSDPAYKSYLWNTAGGSAVTPKIVVQKTGTYVVSVKNEVGCSAESVPVSVKVNALPQKPVISANGNTTFCDGGQVTLSVANAQKYTWNTNASSQTLLVKNSGKFAVIVTNEFGCNSLPSDTLSVTVNPNPAKPSVSAQSSTTFCADSKVTLTSSTEFGYRWSNGETSQSVDLNKTGMFTVKVINQFNCISVSSDVIATRALDLPETPTVSKTGVFNLEANSFGLGDGYEWKLAGKLIADTASIIKASSNGNYSVRKKKVYVVNQANMVCYSASVERTFKAEEAYNGLGVYPNPVSGDKLFIETQYNLENATVTIYDRMGAPIFTGNITLLDGRYYININTLNDGLYLLRVSSSNFDSSKWVSVKR